MKISKIGSKGLEMIKSFEGLKLNPYLCSAGVPTIGYGTTRYPNSVRVTMNDRQITKEQADVFLKHDIRQFELAVDALCTDRLTQNQFDALVCFAYNLGATNLRNSTLRIKVNANPNDPTIRNEFMKWNKAGGLAIRGLTRRRQAEADLYFTP